MREIMMVAFLLVGCGQAEAKPLAGRITVKLAIVGDAIRWCDADTAWTALIHPELVRVTRGRVPIDLEYDMAVADTAPELLTVGSFWSGALRSYWLMQIPPASGRDIRLVVIPPLAGPLYGGWHQGDHWILANGSDSAPRNALIVLHEFGHVLGHCIDVCHPGAAPDLMCAADAPLLKTRPDLLHYSAICERQIRRRLGLRTAGKTLCVGDCK